MGAHPQRITALGSRLPLWGRGMKPEAAVLFQDHTLGYTRGLERLPPQSLCSHTSPTGLTSVRDKAHFSNGKGAKGSQFQAPLACGQWLPT